MKKRIIYTLLFLMTAGWLIADDLPFLHMALDRKNTQHIQGLVTRKFSQGASLSRGGIRHEYFIEVHDLLHECSGTSRISEMDYKTINENDHIPLLRLNHLCLATIDIHSYTPPAMQFIPAGMVFLIALYHIALLIRDLLYRRPSL